ncbi:predicted protein [Lichtheimia corymbifera JMRC:FSU:9682]|uniref:Uncharacterized protein n=1 Tax=Lichtheimia corymbifera JMRC:FSU:9682 TaxID=1263082 RepID=A0A068S1A8_9FUNG|nr:predicted protein [Lichtheimia corymbifera JMRC:FSU:9682]
MVLQISGANCQISSVPLASDGLYVVLKRCNFSLPSSMKDFAGTMEMMKVLMAIQRHIPSKWQRNHKPNKKVDYFGGSFSDFDAFGSDEQPHWMRGTWYTPHRDAWYSVIPSDMFSRVKRYHVEKTVLSSTEATVEDGTYNIHTGKEISHHPLHDNDDR